MARMNDRYVRTDDVLERAGAFALFADHDELRRLSNPNIGSDRVRAAVRAATPQTSIEAVMHCVRERGLAALCEPANQQRLMTFDEDARTEVNKRIAKLEGPDRSSRKDSQNVS
jgi:hypothetical protein